MKKFVSLFLAITFAMPLVVSGCSKSSSSSTSSTAKTTKLTVMWWGSQTRNDATTEVAKLYEKSNPNVKITTSFQSFDGYFQKLSMLAAANSMPDVFQFTVGAATGSEYITKNLVEPLDSYVSKGLIDISDMSDSTVSTGKLNGKLYGVTLGTNAIALALDPAIYKKAGLAVPDSYATWDDLETDLIKLKSVTGAYGADDVLFIDNMFGYWCRQYGQTAYDTSKIIGFDSSTFINFMNMKKKWLTEGIIPPLDVTTTSPSVANSQMAKHKSAMDLIYTNNYADLVKAYGSSLKLIELPGPNTDKGMSVMASQHFVMSSKSENKEAAAKFISYFVNNTDANNILKGERGVPAAGKVRTALKTNATTDQTAIFNYMDEVGKNSSPVDAPAPSNSSSIVSTLNDLEQQVMYNKCTAADAFKTLQATVKSLISNS
jgi:multiple sugar transport system substrate-binding protein